MKIELSVISERPMNAASVLYVLTEAIAEYHKYLTWDEALLREFVLPIDGREHIKVTVSDKSELEDGQ